MRPFETDPDTFGTLPPKAGTLAAKPFDHGTYKTVDANGMVVDGYSHERRDTVDTFNIFVGILLFLWCVWIIIRPARRYNHVK